MFILACLSTKKNFTFSGACLVYLVFVFGQLTSTMALTSGLRHIGYLVLFVSPFISFSEKWSEWIHCWLRVNMFSTATQQRFPDLLHFLESFLFFYSLILFVCRCLSFPFIIPFGRYAVTISIELKLFEMHRIVHRFSAMEGFSSHPFIFLNGEWWCAVDHWRNWEKNENWKV